MRGRVRENISEADAEAEVIRIGAKPWNAKSRILETNQKSEVIKVDNSSLKLQNYVL